MNPNKLGYLVLELDSVPWNAKLILEPWGAHVWVKARAECILKTFDSFQVLPF